MTTDKKATKANTLNDFNTGNWQKQLTLLFCLIVCARDTKATNKTGKKNSARDTNVTNRQTQHRKNSAQGSNVPNNQTEHRENSARATNVINNLIKYKRKQYTRY